MVSLCIFSPLRLLKLPRSTHERPVSPFPSQSFLFTKLLLSASPSPRNREIGSLYFFPPIPLKNGADRFVQIPPLSYCHEATLASHVSDGGGALCFPSLLSLRSPPFSAKYSTSFSSMRYAASLWVSSDRILYFPSWGFRRGDDHELFPTRSNLI